MREHIQPYLKDHETAWAPSTFKSESSRLNSVGELLQLKPEQLMEELRRQGKKPYTIKTTFIRICALERWANIEPVFQTYMEKHERRFRHLYEKAEIEITYEDALKRIALLEGRARLHALGLLHTGLRLSESYAVDGNKVVGKGGKVRKVYGTIKETAPKSTIARKLKAVGLKPHTLRKLCATRLAENGASAADLCKIFGWSSIETSFQYLQAKEDHRLETLMAASETES